MLHTFGRLYVAPEAIHKHQNWGLKCGGTVVSMEGHTHFQ